MEGERGQIKRLLNAKYHQNKEKIGDKNILKKSDKHQNKIK